MLQNLIVEDAVNDDNSVITLSNSMWLCTRHC